MELVFQDADLVPLLVQENYLNHRPAIATNETTRLAVRGTAWRGAGLVGRGAGLGGGPCAARVHTLQQLPVAECGPSACAQRSQA